MTAYTLACPHCGTRLKTAGPVPAGKTVTCPRCAGLFTVAAPAPQPAIEVVDTTPAPPRQRPAPPPPVDEEQMGYERPRPRRTKAGPNKGLVIGLSVGGGVLLLLILGLVLWLVLGGSSSPEKMIVGRWQLVEDEGGPVGPGLLVIMEFTAQGTVLLSDPVGEQKHGTYRFLDRDTVQVELAGGRTDTARVTFIGDEMITAAVFDPTRRVRFRRVR
jgi:hypothetical protein